ncbi:MAG: LPS export ABC transporter periplasmic protein LptC, partial [Burkholderiaceae bacterium]
MRRQAWQRGYAGLLAAGPILIMATLALLTFWLERQTIHQLAEVDPQPSNTEPDFTVRDFVVKQFDANGDLSSELVGEVGT